MNPKVLLNAENPGMDSNDNLIWYSEPHFQHGDIVGTFRHAQCLRVSYKGMMENSTCKLILLVKRRQLITNIVREMTS